MVRALKEDNGITIAVWLRFSKHRKMIYILPVKGVSLVPLCAVSILWGC